MIKTKDIIARQILCGLDTVKTEHGITLEEIVQALAYPPDKNMGDLALPCFKFSKALRLSPVIIAQKTADAFKSDIASAEAVNGYLNIKLNRAVFASSVCEEIKEKGKKYGSSGKGEGKTVVLDYSSPNVAKPFHIGHLGTTVIGHSLKKMYEFDGCKCIGINHLGDWGTQFGKLIVAYKKWGSEKEVENGGIDYLVSLYVRFHKEAEIEPSLNDEARAEFTKLEHFEEEEVALWHKFIDISIEEYKKTYKKLDIEFDYYTGESFYTDKMPAVVQMLKEKNLLKLDDGASIVDLEEYNMPPCLILKRDGSTLYPARDIAAAVYRKNTFDFDKCVYVTSDGQSLHFAQWFKVVQLLGYDWYDKLVHVPYGTVSINGEKLATRTGNVILLNDLFNTATEKVKEIMAEKNTSANDEETAEAVGIGAVIFYYLSANRIRNINFTMEEALNFDGNTGPYAQYTYARTCSILSKAGERSLKMSDTLNEDEYSLVKTLSYFPEVFESALKNMEPSEITRYILSVCADFNRFYHNCQILSAEDENTVSQRLFITECTKTVLGTALELICIKHPEKI